MADNKDLTELGKVLHERLLAERDGYVLDELTELFLPRLVSALKRRFPNLRDPHLVETVANDALMAYIKVPEEFDPNRGSLINYLYMDARGNLLDHLGQRQRFIPLEPETIDRESAALIEDLNPEHRLFEEDSPMIRQMNAVVTDPIDREMVGLMMEGERSTAAYAEALGIQHIPVIEQALLVKRHKDRLKVTLRRSLRRRYYVVVLLGLLAALRDRVKAAPRKITAVVAVAIAVAVVIGVNLHSWQKARATLAPAVTVSRDPQSLSGNSLAQENPTPVLVPGEYVEKIFFSSSRGTERGTLQFHIWMMNPNGSGREQVTFGDVRDRGFDISPDGTKLVFSRAVSPQHFDADNHHSILVKDLASGVEIPVTADSDYPWGLYCSSTPVWSPDGTKIALQRYDAVSFDPGKQMSDIWIVDFLPSIGEPKQITPLTRFNRLDPSWSPDGHLFYSKQVSHDGPYEIWKVDQETMEEERVIPLVVHESAPVVSPDGSKLAWRTDRHSEVGGDIYITDTANPMNSQVRLTPYSGFGLAHWSPDGRSMIAVSVMYRVTDLSLKMLAQFGMPADVVTRLRRAKTRKAMTEPELIDLVRSCIGDELTEKHRYRISQQTAGEHNLSVINANGAGIRQLTSGMNMHQGGRWVRITKESAATIKETQKTKGKRKK